MKKLFLMDNFIKLGFILMVFNDFPKLKIFGNTFTISFLWAIIFVVLNITLKQKIKKDSYIKSIIVIYIYILIRNLLSIHKIEFKFEYLIIFRNIFYATIWVLALLYLYLELGKKNGTEKLKLLKLSLWSYSITGIIEVLNIIFRFYNRNYSEAYGIWRINPLSSESNYYNINIIIPVFIYLYLLKARKLNIIEKLFFLIIIGIITLSFSSSGFFIIVLFMTTMFIFAKNYKKILMLLFIICMINIKSPLIEENIKKNIEIQVNKIIEYGIQKESKDYSVIIRTRAKNIFGKEIYYKNKIFGAGTSGIYRKSKKTGIGLDADINFDAKNFYWTILAQEGIVGIVFYSFFFISIFFNIYRKYKNLKIKKYFFIGYLGFLILLNTYNTMWVQSFLMNYAFMLSIKNEN